jgi:hypothetical protein
MRVREVEDPGVPWAETRRDLVFEPKDVERISIPVNKNLNTKYITSSLSTHRNDQKLTATRAATASDEIRVAVSVKVFNEVLPMRRSGTTIVSPARSVYPMTSP